MIQGFYTAGSGLIAKQTGIDIVANNIANMNTTGYKKHSTRFSELLSSDLKSVDYAKSGNGVRASGSMPDMTGGPYQSTGGGLDFAITSDGFFGVMGSDGNIGYTRDGSFHISGEAGENYLVTAGGEYVLSGNGTKISADDENLQNQIGIFNFGNPYGLSADGDNKFKSTAASGQAYVTVGSIGRGMLETSNVDLTDEMANLMTMQKAYQFNAKMIETADEIENIINNLR